MSDLCSTSIKNPDSATTCTFRPFLVPSVLSVLTGFNELLQSHISFLCDIQNCESLSWESPELQEFDPPITIGMLTIALIGSLTTAFTMNTLAPFRFLRASVDVDTRAMAHDHGLIFIALANHHLVYTFSTAVSTRNPRKAMMFLVISTRTTLHQVFDRNGTTSNTGHPPLPVCTVHIFIENSLRVLQKRPLEPPGPVLQVITCDPIGRASYLSNT
ncbi:hypothetical protein Pelo_14051 [Pelomyxa schiedti]|nr:hypothetical protein Pelo_14051 [Pelomyxa schiedti]